MKIRIGWRTLIWVAAAVLLTVSAEARPYADLIAQGDALRNAAEYRRALDVYAAAEALNPNMALATQRAAETCLAWGRPDRAVEWFRRAQHQEPANPAILIGWGQAYADLGDPARARELWEQVAGHSELGGVAHHRLALLDLQGRDFGAAAVHLQAALAEPLPAGDAQSVRFQLALLQGLDHPAAALPDLRRATVGPDAALAAEAQSVAAALEQSKDASPETTAGAALVGVRRWTLAQAYLERALAHDPNDVTALAYLGACLDGQGDGAGADRRLRLALAGRPDSILTLFFWGRHLARIGQARSARYVFERVLALDPADAAACAEIARTYLSERDYAQAETWFQEATARAPEQAAFFLMLAEFETNSLFNVSKGAAVARRTAELQPDDATAWDALGWALVLSGKWDEAEKSLNRAIRLAPRWANPYHHLGRLYNQQGRVDSARWAFERVLDLAPLGPLLTEAEDALRQLGVDPETHAGVHS